MPVQSNFDAVLSAVPVDDWYRTWPADRTIMLSMTSKRFKELLKKMRFPVDVCSNMSFWNNNRNGNSTADKKQQFIMRQLIQLGNKWNITSLELPNCDLDIDLLPEVLAQCATLEHIDLRSNKIDEKGANILAGVLAQCPSLVHVDLGNNHLCDKGVESLAGVLGQCISLAYLNFKSNNINNKGASCIVGILTGSSALAIKYLDLSNNWIDSQGIEEIARVIPKCPSLVHVNLCNNMFEYKRSEYEIAIEKMFEQCVTLSYFNIESNYRDNSVDDLSDDCDI
jgi:hypothetical protein